VHHPCIAYSEHEDEHFFCELSRTVGSQGEGVKVIISPTRSSFPWSPVG
jgi:hypothetical protein